MAKVLVVDDDHRIALSLGVRLKGAGFEVIEANDGVTAVKQAINEGPDVVLLDISMPAGNGFVVAERLRENIATATVPIIFLTASRRSEQRSRANEYAPFAYLEKPFEAEEIIQVVNDALQSS